jgi:coenzyme PQQ precursor peptide PqqA
MKQCCPFHRIAGEGALGHSWFRWDERLRKVAMRKTWKKPRIVEIAVGLEINSYACPEL